MEIVFILTNPSVPENIGASARALGTMGFSSLRLVSPPNGFEKRAKWTACGSQEILDSAKVFDSLSEAISDVDLVIGATARKRKVRHDYYSPSKLKPLLYSKFSSVSKVAIVFGPENSGLSNDELSLCDLLTTIPSSECTPALNLAQAVMIYTYELSELSFTEKVLDRKKSSHKELKQKARELLLRIDISPSDSVHQRAMERLSALPDDDIRLAHFILSSLLERK